MDSKHHEQSQQLMLLLLLQKHYDKAIHAFRHDVSQLCSSTKQPRPPHRAQALSAVQASLKSFMQHVHDAIQEQLKAKIAAEQARKAAGEKQAVEEERRQEKMVLQAKEHAVARYKHELAEYVSTCTSLNGLATKHKVRAWCLADWQLT